MEHFFCYDHHADSTVLAYVLSELNRRHNYGLDLFLLSVDEGITGYRDDSLETVKRNEIQVPPPPVPCILALFYCNLLMYWRHLFWFSHKVFKFPCCSLDFP
jgi:hypothetical protein